MSLKKKINKEFETKYPFVYKSVKSNYFHFFNDLWIQSFKTVLVAHVIVIILIIIYSNIFDFRALKILEVNYEGTISTLTSGIITLVSINLFVTNLLLTHLNEERDNIQSIIDKRVNFKFVTYLGFALIVCILFLYFFSSNIIIGNAKGNILIFIFYVFIGYIFLLVSLYNKVFNFIHKTKREEIVKKELHQEFYNAFYLNYLNSSFKKEYKMLFEDTLQLEPYSIFKDYKGLQIITKTFSKNSYLVDINKKIIDKIAKRKPEGERIYNKLETDRQYPKGAEINFFYFKNKPKVKFEKIYKFKSKPLIKTKYSQEHLNNLLRKINDNTQENKHDQLSVNLRNLKDIYSEYIELENEHTID